MATFFNKATLSYNNNITDSNIVTGELIEVLSASKNSISENYDAGEFVTFLISILNSGATPFTNLTVTDNLGAYTNGTATLVPLTYESDSIQYYSNGVLQPAPSVTAGPPLTLNGITIPANGNVLLIYQARVNEQAPLGSGASITNTATISGAGLSTPLEVSKTISHNASLRLTISKSITPDSIVENGQITYTFVIQNSGSTPAVATDNAVVTDTFSPILNALTVTFNGNAWSEPSNYTYDETTGLFQTVVGAITVPAATFAQDPVTNEWITTPGVSVLKVTGTI